MLATQTLHQCVPFKMNSKNPNAGNYFMLLRGVAMVTMATDFLKICHGYHGYHSNAPEQHKIIPRIRIFRIHSRNTLVKSLSG